MLVQSEDFLGQHERVTRIGLNDAGLRDVFWITFYTQLAGNTQQKISRILRD